MFEAARVGDGLVHSSALAGFLVGAALGLALIIAVGFATASCGMGAILLAGLLAGVGANLLVALGEAVGKMIQSPAGKITSGSPNVYINGRPAAYAVKGKGECDKHPAPLIAEGSGKVFYNGEGAARKDDHLTCDAVIDSGSNNTFVGAESVQYLEIDSEVPDWLRATVDVLMAVAASATGIAKFAKLAAKNGLKAVAPCALKSAAGFAASEVASNQMGSGISQTAGGLFGNPVDAISGRKLLLEESETDFVIPGLMPITWSRFYASDLKHEGMLGKGWVLPWEESLRRDGEQLLLRDNQGRELAMPLLAANERLYFADEQITLVCTEGGHYLLQTLDNHFFYFGEVAADGQPAPLRRIENAHGQFLHFTYDKQQTLTDISTTGGIRLHLRYDYPNRLTKVERVIQRRPVETLVQYQYDAHGQLTRVIDRNGVQARRFTYVNGLMSSHENALGLLCHYRWSDFAKGGWRVTEHWTNDGEHFHFRYDLENRQTDVLDALGRSAQIHYNDKRRVIASRDFGGEYYQFELDEAGNMTGLTLPDGNKIVLVWDEYSRLREEHDPLGRVTRYHYHHTTNLISAIERPDGSRASWRYDNKGNLLASTDPLGHTTHYYNHENGLPHTQKDPLGNTTHLCWNELAQLEQYQDCSGNKTHYSYDENLHLNGITDALGQHTRLYRRASGEILRIEHPDGTSERYNYDALGAAISYTDSDGYTTYLERNRRGMPILRKDARGQKVLFQYDKALRLVQLVNENQASYQFTYDASDRLQSEVRVDGLRRQYRYNNSGRLAQMTEYAPQGRDYCNRKQQFEYDAAGRLIRRLSSDAQLDYHYNDADQLICLERQPTESGQALGIQAEQLHFAYDAAGQLLEESSAQGRVTYQYDALGNLNSKTLPDGRQINHLYYGSGHLHQTNVDGLLISDFERDALHRETLRTQGGITSCFGYDSRGRKLWQAAIRLPHEEVSQLREQGERALNTPEHPATAIYRRYQYSPGGELTRVHDQHRGVSHYGYDAVGQLRSRESASQHLQSEDFSYDGAGNLCGAAALQIQATPNNRLQAWQDLRFRYDPWGNLSEKSTTSGASQRFAYDCENRLIKAQTWQDNRLQSTATYAYDSLGRRIRKEVAQNEQITRTDFLWEGLRLLQEQQAQHCSVYLYEPGSYAPIARVDSNPSLPEGEPQRYYYHTDQIGTPQELTDADGHIVWRAYYKTWGSLEAVSPNLVEQNLRFQGQYHDLETGLYYNTFRYYDPQVGRFTTQDPIGLAGGFNLYQYAPNALGWVDPLGWCVTPNVTRGSAGHPLRATATITPADLRTGTATNQSSRNFIRKLGFADDDAGHIIARLLGGKGGVDGVFPQLKNINRGSYRAYEKDIAKNIKDNGAVDVDIQFIYSNGGTRPTGIIYDVYRDNSKIMSKLFDN